MRAEGARLGGERADLRRILKRSRMTVDRFCRISPRLPPVVNLDGDRGDETAAGRPGRRE